MSNRLQFVERERIHGAIEGVNFGYRLSCIARSPASVLLWSSGTAYTSGRRTCYGESSLIAIQRSPRFRFHPEYSYVGSAGGRLTAFRVAMAKEQLKPFFDEDDIHEIMAAIRLKKTLLIEGGGPPLMPDRSLGQAAYDAWAALPERGIADTPN